MVATAALLAMSLAQTPSVVAGSAAVIRLCDDDRQTSEVQYAVAQQLGDRGWRVLSSTTPGPAWSRRCSDAPRTELTRRLDRGRALATEGALDAARAELDVSTAVTDAVLMAGDGAMVREAWCRLAALSLMGGDSDGDDDDGGAHARELLRQVIELWPTWRPDPNLFGAELARVHSEVAAALPRHYVELRVVIMPADTEVLLDGEYHPTPDGRFTGVLAGLHFLTVRHGQFGTLSRAVSLTQEPRQEVRADLRGDQRQRWADLIATGGATALFPSLEAVSAAATVLLAASSEPAQSGVAYIAQRQLLGPSLSRVEVLDANSRLAARAIAAQIGDPPEVDEPDDRTGGAALTHVPETEIDSLHIQPRPYESRAVTTDDLRKLWWLWAGLGAAAMLAAGTALTVYAVEQNNRVQIGVRW